MNYLTLHILFLGFAFFQMLFIFIQWFFLKRNEYLYYIAYIGSVIIFILFRINLITSQAYLPLDGKLYKITFQPLAMFSFWMYLRFLSKFLNIEKINFLLFKRIKLLEGSVIIFILIIIFLTLFNVNKLLFLLIYFAGYSVLLILTILVYLSLIRQKFILNYLLTLGSIFYILGGTICLVCNYFINKINATDSRIFFLFEVGILAEILFLNTGFFLKNKILYKQVSKGQKQLLKERIDLKEKLLFTNIRDKK